MMKIRYCPCCAELVHFEAASPIQRCWNCCEVSNFALLKSPEERLALWLLAKAEDIGPRLACVWPRHFILARAVLVGAIPVVITMLLVSNSFDIHVVHDSAAPFSIPDVTAPFPMP